jgi:hypothetical protein
MIENIKRSKNNNEFLPLLCPKRRYIPLPVDRPCICICSWVKHRFWGGTGLLVVVANAAAAIDVLAAKRLALVTLITILKRATKLIGNEGGGWSNN